MIDRAYAIKDAIVNSALSGFHPTDYGLQLYDQWIKELVTVEDAVAALKRHHSALEATEPSDGLASGNWLGITDSRRKKSAEADITTLRIAELVIDPV